MSAILDDKAPYVIPFISERLDAFQKSNLGSKTPFFVGINGVQGAGKTTLVDIIKNLLQSAKVSTVVFSLDDFYLPYHEQISVAKAHPENPLLQHRGQPGTHDLPLALETIKSLKEARPTKIPKYNKAAMSGHGDRLPEEEWEVVNTNPSDTVKVILFEGWCVGFRPLDSRTLNQTHEKAVQAVQSASRAYSGRLGYNTLQSVTEINEALKQYDAITNQLDAFIYINAAEPRYVYKWRAQAERELRRTKGSGMTDEEVKTFIDGYFPSYELYTVAMREGVFRPTSSSGDESWRRKQLNMMIGEDRKVKLVVST